MRAKKSGWEKRASREDLDVRERESWGSGGGKCTSWGEGCDRAWDMGYEGERVWVLRFWRRRKCRGGLEVSERGS